MERVSNSKVNSSEFLLSNETQSIVNRKSNSSRASDAVGQCNQNSMQSIVKRSCVEVSQQHPTGDSLVQKKFGVTDQNSEIDIVIFIDDLFSSASKFNDIPEGQLRNVTLKIENLKELEQLQTLFPNQPNTNFFSKFINQPVIKPKPKCIDKIKGLDLEKLHFNTITCGPINVLFATIDQNLGYFPRLTSLAIGDIGNNIPFPQIPNNLTILTIGNINDGRNISRDNIELSNNLNKLTTLIIGNIRANVKFSSGMNNLKTLIIGDILANIKLTLPNDLNKLSAFTIGTIWTNTTLPGGLYELLTLTIGYIGANVRLSNDLNKLSTLIIKEIGHNAILELPDFLSSLTNLTIEKIWTDVTFSSGLSHLKILKIEYVGANVTLLANLNNLISLSIKDLKPKTTLTLPDNLNSLEIFTIETLQDCVTIKFPKNLNNLITLIIEEICNDAILELPDFLNSLITFIIKRIGKNVMLKLPSTLNNLQFFTIEELGANILTSEPNQPDCVSKFVLENTSGTTIKLPDSLPNLINCNVGKIASDSTLSGATSFKRKLTVINNSANVVASSLIISKAIVQHFAKTMDETFGTFAYPTTFLQNRIAKILPTDETLKQKATSAMHNKINTIKWSTFGIYLRYMIAGWFGIGIGALIGATYGILTTKETF